MSAGGWPAAAVLCLVTVAAWSRALRVLPRRAGAPPALIGSVAPKPSMLVVRWRRRTRSTSYPLSLAAALESVARSLRAGASLGVALGDAAGGASGALGEQLRSISACITIGQPMAVALDDWRASVADRDSPSVGLATAVLQLADRVGGATARALDGVASSLRDTAGVQRETRALAAQAAASALVMIAAPLGYTVISLASGSSAARVLIGTAAGRWCLALGVALDALAAAWMRAIIRNVA